MRGTYDPHPDHARPLTLIQLEHQLDHEEKERVQRAREREEQKQAKENARLGAEAEEHRKRAETARRNKELDDQRWRRQNEIARRYQLREDILIFAIRFGICVWPMPKIGIGQTQIPL